MMAAYHRSWFSSLIFWLLCFMDVIIINKCDNSCNIQIKDPSSFTLSASSDQDWLNSGPVSFYMNGKWRSTQDGSLTFVGPEVNQTEGDDEIGSYFGNAYNFQGDNVTIETEIRKYTNSSTVMFVQRYPAGLKGSSFDVNKTISGFPSIKLETPPVPLGYLSFGSSMFGDAAKKFGQFGKTAMINDGLDGSGPLLIYDKTGHVLLMAPFSNVMAASMWNDVDSANLNWGIMGGVDELQPGFEHKTIVFCSMTGIKDAFAGWGGLMRRVNQKTDDVIKYNQQQDISLTHLGYWTANGGYYYYNTEQGKNYQDTLLDVKKDAIERHIPYRYIQLDSWFYPKDNIAAVIYWDANETIFPKGIKGFQDILQMPLVAHNRYWSVNTTYDKLRGGLFDFFIGRQMSLPLDQVFWDYLLGHGREEWGMAVYEQGWLNDQFLFTEALNTNLTLGRTWLEQMAKAAIKHELKMQYCMALPRQAMKSVEFPAVTQARVSNDYQMQDDQWKIGVTSHFAHAMGVAPSKDVFWTIGNQPGNTYGKTEACPSLQTVVSVLSTGPVGPGDGIGLADRDVLMKCCDEDGLLLKPSAPALAIDDEFLEMAFQDGSGLSGEIWSTFSAINGQLYGIVFAANLTKDYTITPQKAGFLSQYNQAKFSQSIIFNPTLKYDNTIVYQTLNDTTEFVIKASDCVYKNESFCLFYTSPLIQVGEHQVYLLGDLNKWVPMSEQRIYRVWQQTDGLALNLRGQQGEVVYFTFLLDGQQYTVSLPANEKGCVSFVIVDYPHSGAPRTFTPSPTDTDCRFKPQPFTTPGPKPVTTPGGRGGAQTVRVSIATWWFVVVLISSMIRIRLL